MELDEDLEEIIYQAKNKALADFPNQHQFYDILNLKKENIIEPTHEKNEISTNKVNDKKTVNTENIKFVKKDFENIDENRLKEHKKFKKISADIAKLYIKINKMASEAKSNYGIDLNPMEPLKNCSNLKITPDILKFKKHDNDNNLLSHESIIKEKFEKNKLNLDFSIFSQNISINYRDNKIPANIMKKLRMKKNEEKSDSSRIILPNISYNKFGLKNKSLPSIYD